MHLERGRNYLDEKVPLARRLTEIGRLIAFYVPWYLRQWRSKRLPFDAIFRHSQVRAHLQFVERASRRLARAVLYAILRQRQALQHDQGRQNRIETIGEDLLVIAVSSLYAEERQRTAGETEAWDLAETVFGEASARVKQQIRELILNHDIPVTIVGKKALTGTYSLSKGIIERRLKDYRVPIDTPGRAREKREHAVV
jgi:hypothetical protein